MSTDSMHIFAERLVKYVRDNAIRSYDVVRRENPASPLAIKYNRTFGEGVDTIIDFAVPDIVDTTIYYLLSAIDGDDLKMLFDDGDGNVIDLNSEGKGEMAGSFIAEDSDGWRQRYSQVRIME